MSANESEQTVSIFDGAKRLLQGLPKAASAIIGLSGFAYIVGWLYGRSYFTTFGARWLASEVPLLTMVGYSWWPVIVVIFYAYLGVTDLAGIEKENNIEESSRFKMSRGVLNYGRWAIVVLAISDLVVSIRGYPSVAKTLSYVTVFIVVAVATCAFEVLAVRLSKPNLKLNLQLVYLTYAIIFFGLYLAPTQMGKNSALQDKDLKSSTLPLVVLRDEPNSSYRLLMAAGDRFYIFPEKYETNNPPIQIVSATAVKSIQGK